MYAFARIRKPEYDGRGRDRPARKRVRAREDSAPYADVRLSRFERGLLAFDRLIRRIGNPR
jgi:hypothetical protein